MNNPNPYYSFLIRHRVYCSHPGCLDTFNKATHVVNINGHDEVFCSHHAGRLDAARKSDARQFSETRDQNPKPNDLELRCSQKLKTTTKKPTENQTKTQ